MSRDRAGSRSEPFTADPIRIRGLYSALVSPSNENRAANALGLRPRSSQRSGGLLAALLVGALLLCHGVFGFAHEVSCHGCASTDLLASMSQAGHEHGPKRPVGHAATPATGEDPAGGHAAFAGYFGVVLSLFGAATLGLLLRGAWRRFEGAIMPPRRPVLLPAVAGLPRGPTLPLLQVFRL